MKRIKNFFWPFVGVVAVFWSLYILYDKLKLEAIKDSKPNTTLEKYGILEGLSFIFVEMGHKLHEIPSSAYILCLLSTFVAYASLAYYDRISLIYLKRQKDVSWLFIAVCSFVTYAISHNIGGSVVSGGMVRYRAYSSRGLSTAEIAMLVALCSITFTLGILLLSAFILIYNPLIVIGQFPLLDESFMHILGFSILGGCAFYVIGSLLQFKPLKIRKFKLEYPSFNVVYRQLMVAPVEIIGAAGIIYFALPMDHNPGFVMVLGAFILSFSVGLLFQVPGGIGIMEAVFLKIIPNVPATELFAAILVWRLFYLIIPLALSVPVVLWFERQQLKNTLIDE